MNKKAFTLAEVLITLAIIGVVAALTIPTVVRNYQKHQTVTQLKKTYSALSNTTNLAIAEHGPMTGWEISGSGTAQGAVDFANTYLIPYLKVAKNCESQKTGVCEFKFRFLNRETETKDIGNVYTRFYLNDGTLIALTVADYINWNGAHQIEASTYIDVNGQRKPNTMGKDIFFFRYQVLNTGSGSGGSVGRFLPYCLFCGMSALKTGSDNGCNRTGGNGSYCTALIMQEGWQIKDDYPW